MSTLPVVRKIYVKGSTSDLPEDYTDEILEVLSGELSPHRRSAGWQLSTDTSQYTDPRTGEDRWAVEIHRFNDYLVYDFATFKAADTYTRTLFDQAGLTYTEETA
jgi:hypothetical protein